MKRLERVQKVIDNTILAGNGKYTLFDRQMIMSAYTYLKKYNKCITMQKVVADFYKKYDFKVELEGVNYKISM